METKYSVNNCHQTQNEKSITKLVKLLEEIVYGYIKDAQMLFPTDNSFFIIAQPIQHLIFSYYHRLYIAIAIKIFDIKMILFKELAEYLPRLPPVSKMHIWHHAVKIKSPDGSKTVPDQTRNEKSIAKLVGYCVIIYIKVCILLN